MSNARAMPMLLIALAVAATACTALSEPSITESWAADLTTTGQVLIMTFDRHGSDLSGAGTLAFLTNPAAESLTLLGTRRADTLDITYSRAARGSFRFVGYYAKNGSLLGTLDGAEFNNVSAMFKSH